jgi:hypothetical protein
MAAKASASCPADLLVDGVFFAHAASPWERAGHE